VSAVTAALLQESVGQDAALEEGVELVLDDRGSSDPLLASVWAIKLAACCCTRRYNMVRSGRSRS